MDAVETLTELGDPDPIVGVEPVDDLFDGSEGHCSGAVRASRLFAYCSTLGEGVHPPSIAGPQWPGPPESRPKRLAAP
jgi:hypothetical protein